MDAVCVSFLSSPLRLSAVSVVFDFSASLNSSRDLSPIYLSVSIKPTRQTSKRLFVLCDWKTVVDSHLRYIVLNEITFTIKAMCSSEMPLS